jgi:hypothetical protein
VCCAARRYGVPGRLLARRKRPVPTSLALEMVMGDSPIGKSGHGPMPIQKNATTMLAAGQLITVDPTLRPSNPGKCSSNENFSSLLLSAISSRRLGNVLTKFLCSRNRSDLFSASCYSSNGHERSGGPRVTIFCSGGVVPVTPIVYYAYAYNTNTTFSAILAQSVVEAVGLSRVVRGPSVKITIYSNFDAPLPQWLWRGQLSFV